MKHQAENAGRKTCKGAVFAPGGKLPCAKTAPPAAYTPPQTIHHRGAAAPDPPASQ